MLSLVSISLLLTNSKIAIISIFFLIIIGLVESKRWIAGILLCLAIVLSLVLIYLNHDGNILLLIADMYSLDLDRLVYRDYSIASGLSVITYGRFDVIESAFRNQDRGLLDVVLGVGQLRSTNAMNGRVGIEMDILDSLNIYGILGLIFLVSFYYLPMFKIKTKVTDKIMFSIVIIYSAFGGHFYNNPLVGTIYGIMLGLIENENSLWLTVQK